MAAARSSAPGEQVRLAGEINALLAAMREPGNEAAEAKAVLAELGLASLEGLLGPDGRSCRAEAVETLLACGFPHALEVLPEDLAHHHELRERRAKGPLPLVLAGALVAGAIFGLVVLSRQEDVGGFAARFIVVVGAALLLGLFKTMRR